jgi:hypothetical protein
MLDEDDAEPEPAAAVPSSAAAGTAAVPSSAAGTAGNPG